MQKINQKRNEIGIAGQPPRIWPMVVVASPEAVAAKGHELHVQQQHEEEMVIGS